MSTPEPLPSIDATIAAAVHARIEAEVARALMGDEVIGQYVAAALSQPVEVKDRSSYRTTTVPFLTTVLRKAMQDATEAAVRTLIASEMDAIETEVRKALRRDLAAIAGTLTKSLVDAADKTYGINVDMTVRMPTRD
jgi:hypothetical protein